MTKKVLAIFYNLRGYDSHLIFIELNKFDVKIDVTPNGLEKYIAFYLNKNLVFIDTMQFLNFNLDKLVKNLSEGDFKYFAEEFVSKNLKLLKQKGAYPYEDIDSFKRFNKEKLFDKECFYRSVKGGETGDIGEKLDGHISDEEYLTCEKIWKEFGMKNMDDYHDHYLKKDLLLLANVFEKFNDTCMKLYGLDPCHYFSSPVLSWDAMLKMTGIEFKKISDIDKYLFIEKGLRGGISYIAKRYAKAKNKYMKVHDSNERSRVITYLDMNNLYGWTMSGYLLYDGFKWLKNVDRFDVDLVSESNPVGYSLQVDLEHPDELHELHNDYPLNPEKLSVSYEMMSD